MFLKKKSNLFNKIMYYNLFFSFKIDVLSFFQLRKARLCANQLLQQEYETLLHLFISLVQLQSVATFGLHQPRPHGQTVDVTTLRLLPGFPLIWLDVSNGAEGEGFLWELLWDFLSPVSSQKVFVGPTRCVNSVGPELAEQETFWYILFMFLGYGWRLLLLLLR